MAILSTFRIVSAGISRQKFGMKQELVNLSEFSHVVDLLDQHSSPAIVDEALVAAGLNRKLLSIRSGFVPYAAEAILVETVARAMGDRHLGARISQKFDYKTYGAYARFVLSAPDLATALDRGRRALVLTHPGSEIVIIQSDTHIVIGRASAGLSVLGRRQLDEGTPGVIMQVVQHFLRQDWRPDWIEMPDEPQTEIDVLEEIIGAPIRIGARHPAVAVRLTDLSAPNPDVPNQNDTISLADLEKLMGVAPVQKLEDAVLQLLEVTFALEKMSEDDVAKLLAIGPRTLQRALKNDGTSFQQIRSRFLEGKARYLLSETDIPVEAVAKKLGYQHPKSFRRAFKRWSGATPSEYRRSIDRTDRILRD
jgi:AraC-like DNA-binding protein